MAQVFSVPCRYPRQRPIWSFARLGGFVIRCPLRTQFALFLGSSAVEHSTVNRMVAGSNPARGANEIKHLAQYLKTTKNAVWAVCGQINYRKGRHPRCRRISTIALNPEGFEPT